MLHRLENMVQRVKIVSASIAGRTLLQHTGLDEDARDAVECLHPFGWVASPIEGADAIEVQIGANASHKVVLGGDHTADAVGDLQPGEAGLSRNGQQLILRGTGTESISPLLRWGFARSGLKRLVQEQFVALFNAHVHSNVQPGSGNSGPPTTPMDHTHLTGGT